MMTDRELMYIKSIYEERSIVRASRKLSVAQPSISQAIQRVEEDIGVKLFVRMPAGLRPNRYGEAYYQVAVDILKAYERFETRIGAMKNDGGITLRLGIAQGVSSAILPSVLPAFMKAHPEIRLEVTEDPATDPLPLLRNREIDFAVRYLESADDCRELRWETLAADELVLVISQAHELRKKAVSTTGKPYPVVRPADLKGCRLIQLDDPGWLTARYQTLLRIAGMESAKAALSTKYLHTAVQLALRNAGVTLCPLMSLPRDTPASCILSLPDSVNPFLKLAVFRREDTDMPGTGDALVKCLKKQLTTGWRNPAVEAPCATDGAPAAALRAAR